MISSYVLRLRMPFAIRYHDAVVFLAFIRPPISQFCLFLKSGMASFANPFRIIVEVIPGTEFMGDHIGRPVHLEFAHLVVKTGCRIAGLILIPEIQRCPRVIEARNRRLEVAGCAGCVTAVAITRFVVFANRVTTDDFNMSFPQFENSGMSAVRKLRLFGMTGYAAVRRRRIIVASSLNCADGDILHRLFAAKSCPPAIRFENIAVGTPTRVNVTVACNAFLFSVNRRGELGTVHI